MRKVALVLTLAIIIVAITSVLPVDAKSTLRWISTIMDIT